MEWNDEKTLKLIDLFHSRELLWNPKHSDYKNRTPKRFEALNELANELSTNVVEIERKIKNLTSQYYREKKKVDDSKKSGKDDIYQTKWFAYKALEFLQNKNKAAGTIDTESPSESNDAQPRQSNSPQISAEDNFSQPNKRPRRNTSPEIVTQALNIMKSVSQRPNETQAKDEDTLFGDYIAGQLRKMDKLTNAIVRHRINNVIFEAETGFRADTFPDFAKPSSSQNYPRYNTASSIPQPSVSPCNNSSYEYSETPLPKVEEDDNEETL